MGSLFGDGDEEAPAAPAGAEIEAAIDAVRARFGADALGAASLIGPGDRLRLDRRGTPYGPAEDPPSDSS